MLDIFMPQVPDNKRTNTYSYYVLDNGSNWL